MLLERPGDVVTREEIRAKLWPDGTFVDFDSNISSAVRKLRDTLCDSAAEPRHIETVGRVGYRFIGQAEFANESAGPRLKNEVARPETLPNLTEARSLGDPVLGETVAVPQETLTEAPPPLPQRKSGRGRPDGPIQLVLR